MNDIFHKTYNWSLLPTPGLVLLTKYLFIKEEIPALEHKILFLNLEENTCVCDFLKHIIFMRKKGLPIFLLMNDLVNVT